MKKKFKTILLGLFGGFLLACMLYLNSRLGSFSSPVTSSLIAHFVGLLTSLFVFLLISLKRNKNENFLRPSLRKSPPYWTYFCGLFGGIVVIVGVKCVNSWLGVVGTVILGIIGQILFSLLIDHYGFFGNKEKKVSNEDLKGVALLVLGCVTIILSKV